MFNKIENSLINFQKPGRYIGNESGIPDKDFKNAPVRVVIGYPDIYEVGMSNQGIKIIYDRINRLDFASCERVFSCWIDFENFLRKQKIPLYSLETKTPLNQFDIIGISIQYELLFTNFLNILDLSQIEVFAKKRKGTYPIIICGGPSVVNPAPFAPFVDLFLIGEAEGVIEELLNKFHLIKNKYTKKEIINELSNIQGIYSPIYSKNIVKRQIYQGFSEDNGLKSYIIPNIDIVQNKLVVEIMRGCPNKCRFCLAGVIYKPYREKNIDIILNSIENGIKKLGVNEITLSSLSSGDYSQIIPLTESFIKKFSPLNISFSLPSIRVETFDVELLEKISHVRKSGLTFAIESGSGQGQLSINKPINIDKITKIIKYASENGWKLIKLYFMIGLPHCKNEKEDIISFIDYISSINKKLKININIAVFVPKPHTPYQYERQIPLQESLEILHEIEKYYFRSRVKIKKHNPYMSYVEGFIARGDKNVGLAIYEAFKEGARFDGWKECFNFDIYKKVFDKMNITYEKYLSKKKYNAVMPWDNINVGLSKEFYLKEIEKSKNKIISKSCKYECDKNCKICDNDIKKIDSKGIINKVLPLVNKNNLLENNDNTRYFLEFSKKGLLRFIGHIDIIKYFEKLFLRSNISVLFTKGFNPHPKMQFSSALSLGIESECEILEFYTTKYYNEDELLSILKKYQHNDMSINRIRIINFSEKYSLIENILFSIYSFNFDKKYYEKIKNIYEKYKCININYQFERKNKICTGKYQDYIEMQKLENTKIIAKIKKISPSPKILQALKDIFDDIPILIKKEMMYALKEDKIVELFEISKEIPVKMMQQ